MKLRSAAVVVLALCSCGAPAALSPPAEPSSVTLTRLPAAEVIPEDEDDRLPLTLVPAWPAGASVDGDLSEWADAPGMDLGKAGPDGGARVWLAPSGEGLFVAGEVRDVDVRPSDRIEIALAFPGAELPPLGFASQWGTEEVPSAAWCEDPERLTGPDEERDRLACKQWFEDNTAKRRAIPALFRAHYTIGQAGAALRAAATPPGIAGAVEGAPPPLRSVVRRFDKGYRFEALIPPEALPATSEAPLLTLRAVVEVIDAVAEGERVFSSAPASRVENVETWTEAILKAPVHFGRAPALLERVLEKAWVSFEEQRPFYYLPSNPNQVRFLVNPVLGYQAMPEVPSPAVVVVDLDDQRPIGALGEITVVDLPLHPGYGFTPWRGLATFRAGELIDLAEASDFEPSKAVARPPGLHLLRTYNGTMNPLAVGMCGACPRVDFEVVQVDATGRFAEPLTFGGVGGSDVDKLEALAMNARTGFGVRGNTEDPSSGAKTGFEIVYRWDTKSSEYVRSERTIPPLP
jgi:hypothetical protein